MVSFSTASNHLLASPCSATDLNLHTFPSCLALFGTRRRARNQEQGMSLNLAVASKVRIKGGSFWGFLQVKRLDYSGSSCWCGSSVDSFRKDWDGEEDLALEAEILEFMMGSENPDVFPTKKQLMDAGRMDLVEAIARQGGWLTFGWDFSDEHKEEENEFEDWDLIKVKDYKNGAVQERVEGGEKGNEVSRYSVSSFAVNSSGSASSSGRSLEAAAEEDSGIEGILSRLEKERSINFGFGLSEKGKAARVQSDDNNDDWLAGTSKNKAVADHGRTSRPASLKSVGGIINNATGKLTKITSLSDLNALGNSLKPEMWRTWSAQRAGFSNTELKAAEIASNKDRPLNVSGDETFDIRQYHSENLSRQDDLSSCDKEIGSNQIQSRLRELEMELSSVLRSVRSNSDDVVLAKGYESSSEDLRKLSDAWEFQENEIMDAQDRLRSIRAKLAVLEGKMALAIIDAQKMVEGKQKRIDDARRDLRLLRTACIVWPNSASEVLLAGSFDGWASKRMMEKSSTGIFSLSLKLYPGKYEIKFIVDGEWKIDPLRPIVYSGGYENNLLIIM